MGEVVGLGLHFEGGVTGGDPTFECVTQGNEASMSPNFPCPAVCPAGHTCLRVTMGGCKYQDLEQAAPPLGALLSSLEIRGSRARRWSFGGCPPSPHGSAETAPRPHARCPRGPPGSRCVPGAFEGGEAGPGLTLPGMGAAVGARADYRACTVQERSPGWGDSCGFWWLSVAVRLGLG